MPEIQMPKLSDTMTEGTLVAWKKRRLPGLGRRSSRRDRDRQSDDGMGITEDGTLTEIYVPEGGKVNVVTGSRSSVKVRKRRKKRERKKKKKKRKKNQKPRKKKRRKEAEKRRATKGINAENRRERGEKAAPPTKAEKKAEPEKPSPKIEKVWVKVSPVARRVPAELGVDYF